MEVLQLTLPQESGKAAEASPAPAPMVEAVRSPVTGPKPPAGRERVVGERVQLSATFCVVDEK